ncbi:MFS transporter [Aspergillus undulatus]|uniref:MFS transporter n=1 Tax=Aspergillus undulatus TaxID=1810928 RepID=UPI003CCE539C
MTADASSPWGYQWRSSQSFIIATATISLFSECFLFGFVVPILPYMLEQRLHLDPSRTQTSTTALLTTYGLISLISAPFIAHFADKTPSRKIPLLLSLAACATGTILVACSRAIWILTAGQIMQSISSASVWIVGMATLVDNVDGENKGKVVGTAMSVVATGVVAGPMVSGILLEVLGYWPAWSGALLLLAIDFFARLVMIDNHVSNRTKSDTGVEANEQTRLLSEPNNTDTPPAPEPETADKCQDRVPARGFYTIMLSNPKILASLLNTLCLSMILASFDTTLPLHVRAVFGWGSLPTGIIFLGLQVPSIVFGSLIGWLRDRVGLRWPSTIGWGLMAPLLWLLGVPGADMPWGRLERGGEAVYILAISGLGFAFAFTRGAGSFQMMAVVHDLERQNPNIFGPYGGNSRLSGLTEVPFNIGMMLGPLVSGTISEIVGYYWTNTALAGISCFVALSSWVYLTAAPQPQPQKVNEREEEGESRCC